MAALVRLEPILLHFFGGRSARRRKKKYAEEREGQVAKSYHTVRAPAWGRQPVHSAAHSSRSWQKKNRTSKKKISSFFSPLTFFFVFFPIVNSLYVGNHARDVIVLRRCRHCAFRYIRQSFFGSWNLYPQSSMRLDRYEELFSKFSTILFLQILFFSIRIDQMAGRVCPDI